MPVSGYYGGHGESVMKAMMRTYGAKKGKAVFYATAKKKGQEPGEKMASHLSSMHRRGKFRKRK